LAECVAQTKRNETDPREGVFWREALCTPRSQSVWLDLLTVTIQTLLSLKQMSSPSNSILNSAAGMRLWRKFMVRFITMDLPPADTTLAADIRDLSIADKMLLTTTAKHFVEAYYTRPDYCNYQNQISLLQAQGLLALCLNDDAARAAEVYAEQAEFENNQRTIRKESAQFHAERAAKKRKAAVKKEESSKKVKVEADPDARRHEENEVRKAAMKRRGEEMKEESKKKVKMEA